MELTSIEQGDDNVNRDVRFPFPVGRVHRLLKKGNRFSFPVGRVHRLLKKGNRFPFPVSRVHHLLKKGNHAQYVSACAPGQYYLACIFSLVKFKFYFD